MRFEISKIIRRKASLLSIGGLFLSMILYTITLVLGTIDLNKDYNRAGLAHIDKTLSFYFLPSESSMRIPDAAYGICSLLLFFFLIPILMTILGPSSYYDDYQAKTINQLTAKKGLVSYLVDKGMVSFVVSFLTVFSAIIFQCVFATLLVRLINGDLIHYFEPELHDVLINIIAAIRISLYYACIMTLATAMTTLLFKTKYLSYFIPLIISILIAFSFPRVPLDLAFVYSGYIDKSLNLYYYLIIITLCSSVIINVINLLMKRKRLIA